MPVSTGILSGLAWAGGADQPTAFRTRPRDYGARLPRDADGDGRSAQVRRLRAADAPRSSASARGALDADSRAAAGFSVEGFTNLRSTIAGLGSGAGDVRVANTADIATVLRLSARRRHGRRRLDRRVGARAAGRQLRPRHHPARDRPRPRPQALARGLGARDGRRGLRLARVHGDDLPPVGGRRGDRLPLREVGRAADLHDARHRRAAGDVRRRLSPPTPATPSTGGRRARGRTLVNGAGRRSIPAATASSRRSGTAAGATPTTSRPTRPPCTVDLRPGQHSVFSQGPARRPRRRSERRPRPRQRLQRPAVPRRPAVADRGRDRREAATTA